MASPARPLHRAGDQIADQPFIASSKAYTACSGTRMRQVGHTVLETDLSSVIDPRSRVAACRGSKAELQWLKISQSCHVSTDVAHLVNQAACSPFCLQSHPGCVVFPGWLTPEAQVQVASDAFTVFPDAPAKTNHSARFGGLNGLWAAAEANQVLQPAPTSGKPCEDSRWGWVDTCTNHLNKKGSPRPGVITARHLLRHLRWSTLGPAYDWTLRRYEPDQEHLPLPSYLRQLALCFAHLAAAATLVAPRSHGPELGHGTPTRCPAPRARCRTVVPAAAHQAHADEPGSSAQSQPNSSHHEQAAAVAAASDGRQGGAAETAAAVLCWHCAGGAADAATGSCRCTHEHLPTSDGACDPADFDSSSEGGRCAEDCQAAHGGSAASDSAGVPPFDPDAAIVNYYWEGDTLNGHQDDVEEDLRQPIVSLSVGCDAVFLIGGRSKAVAPTALLLGSGDVVVMSADARLSYHGVPRVFQQHDLPAELINAELSTPVQVNALAELQRCRVNVSLRHTAKPL
eukprot:jgi/Ulvmu1/6946/UM033_0003.1